MKIDNDIYYNPHDLESFNSLFNFVIGDRGKGKTFSFAKFRPIERFIKYGEQFIYLRRYKNELKEIKLFLDDVREFFPDNKLEVKNRTFLCDGKVMGHAVHLSTANMLKSTPYPNVQTIIYDEFILEKGYIRYLPNEVHSFLSFYETVARLRENVKVYFLGNAVSIVNPYFIHWKIMPNTNNRFTKVLKTVREGKKGRYLVLVEILQEDVNDNKDKIFRQVKLNTDFGELVDGTSYGQMANENKFSDDSNDFIMKKTESARYLFSIAYNGRMYGIWLDALIGYWFVSNKLDKNSTKTYAITTEDFGVNMYLVDNLSNFNGLKQMVKSFTSGYLMFENNQVKSEMYDAMKMLGC